MYTHEEMYADHYDDYKKMGNTAEDFRRIIMDALKKNRSRRIAKILSEMDEDEKNDSPDNSEK